MPRYHATVDTPWPVERAFAYMASFDNTRDWDPGVAAARRTDGGELVVGSEFRLDFKVGPRTMELVYRIVALDVPRTVTLLSDNSPLVSRDVIAVEATPGGSRIAYDAELSLKGVLGVLDPLLAIGFRRAADKALAGLRGVVAGTPTG